MDREWNERSLRCCSCVVLSIAAAAWLPALALAESLPRSAPRSAGLPLRATPRTGVKLEIVVPSTAHNVTSMDNPIVGFDVTSAGSDDDLFVFTYVNGTWTGLARVEHSAQGSYNDMHVRMPWPLPAKAQIELRYCDASGRLPCPGAAQPGTSISYTWLGKMKVAGVSFWHVRAGNAIASIDVATEQDAIDEQRSDLGYSLSADAILRGDNVSVGDQLTSGIECSYENIWQFQYHATRTLPIGDDASCLSPTVRIGSRDSEGPAPQCTRFAALVTKALAKADPHYADYVNVVIVDTFTVYDTHDMRYYTGAAAGTHYEGAKWIAVANDFGMMGQTIVHEWGHQVGLGHVTDPKICKGRFRDPIMCAPQAGFGIDAAFCDAISKYTGTKNWNPVAAPKSDGAAALE